MCLCEYVVDALQVSIGLSDQCHSECGSHSSLRHWNVFVQNRVSLILPRCTVLLDLYIVVLNNKTFIEYSYSLHLLGGLLIALCGFLRREDSLPMVELPSMLICIEAGVAAMDVISLALF